MNGYLFEMVPDDEPSREEAMNAIARIREQLLSAWLIAMDEWQAELTLRAKTQLTNRSRACCLSDFAVEAAKQLLGGTTEVDLDPDLGFFKIYLDDRFLLRLKRLNHNKLARNVRTRQQRDYYCNRPVSGIRNHCKRLTIGYQLSPAEDQIEDVLVTSQYGTRTLLWASSIMDDPGAMRMPAPQTPVAPTPPTIVVPRKRGKHQGG